jgi:transposase-like protein
MANTNRSARAEFWQQVLNEYRESGATVISFCASKGVSVASFYQWKQKLQPKSIDPAKNSIVSVKLIPVQSRAANASRVVQIFTPSGYSIRVDSAMALHDLSGILQAIESSASRGDAC